MTVAPVTSKPKGKPRGRAGGAPAGNQNAVKGKMFYTQLRLVLTQHPERLRSIAETLISEAEKGEPWAVKELIDRMDGKAVQATTLENVDGSTPTLAGIQVMFVKSPAADE